MAALDGQLKPLPGESVCICVHLCPSVCVYESRSFCLLLFFCICLPPPVCLSVTLCLFVSKPVCLCMQIMLSILSIACSCVDCMQWLHVTLMLLLLLSGVAGEMCSGPGEYLQGCGLLHGPAAHLCCPGQSTLHWYVSSYNWEHFVITKIILKKKKNWMMIVVNIK